VEGRAHRRQDQVIGASMTTIDERFLAKCEEKLDNGCIEWKGTKTQRGYGSLRIGPASAGRILAHRYAYERIHGDIPPGLVVMHSCDNPRCVNHRHLQLGTHKDNTADMIKKGRQGWRVKTPWQKLSKADADVIRQLHQQGIAQRVIASKFGVSPPLVSMLLNGALRYAI